MHILVRDIFTRDDYLVVSVSVKGSNSFDQLLRGSVPNYYAWEIGPKTGHAVRDSCDHVSARRAVFGGISRVLYKPFDLMMKGIWYIVHIYIDKRSFGFLSVCYTNVCNINMLYWIILK
jgi:hypothetical protein